MDETASLLDRATLTDEEIRDCARPTLKDQGGRILMSWSDPLPRDVADAATAKSLWAVVEWLKDEDRFRPYGSSYELTLGQHDALKMVKLTLKDLLLTAGIERPKEVSNES